MKSMSEGQELLLQACLVLIYLCYVSKAIIKGMAQDLPNSLSHMYHTHILACVHTLTQLAGKNKHVTIKVILLCMTHI